MKLARVQRVPGMYDSLGPTDLAPPPPPAPPVTDDATTVAVRARRRNRIAWAVRSGLLDRYLDELEALVG